jgi:type I restriction enzyme S subunit
MVFEGAEHVRRQTRDASIGTTRAGFNTNLLAELDVPLPPLAEQDRIIAEVERRLSVVDVLGMAVEASLKRAERLRQAILRRAFEGRLVPTEAELAQREGRDYEPASALLERIKAARTSPPGPRSRGERGRAGGRGPAARALAGAPAEADA